MVKTAARSLLVCENNMDIRTLFYNLREEVSCPVCSDLFKDPRQLPCLHSFCLHCLKHWHQTSGGQNAFRCPKCQALSRVPASGDLKDLPTSFYLNGLIDVLAIKECNTTQVTCGNCDKKSSEASYCFQCCMFYCEQCLIGHNMMRNNKDHRVLAVKEFQDKDFENVLKRPVFCSRQGHQKEELKYVCKKCEAAVCQTCVTLDHGGHTLKLVEEEAEAQKIEMTALIQEQRQNLRAYTNLVTQLDENYAKLIQQSENVKTNVNRFTDDLIKTIQAKRQNIVAAVENETRKSGENVARTRTEIQQKITMIESSLEKADKLLTRSINAEVLQLKKSLATILEEAEQAKHVFRDPELYLPTVVFVENQKIENIIKSEEIGFLEILFPTKASESIAEGKGLREGTVGREAQFSLTSRNANKRQCYDKRDNVTVEMRDEHGLECVKKVQVDDNKDGIYNISYSPKVQGSCKLSIKVNGEHVRNSPFTVLVKPFHVKPVLSFGKEGSVFGMFKNPLGVAVSSRDEIAVADQMNHRIQIFNSNGDLIRSFGRKGSNQGEFKHPFGIAFDKDGKIFVADSDNNRVQIFNGEGRYMGMFGGKGSLDSQLSDPWGLSLDSQGNIIVADTGNKLIKIFSPDGNFLMKIGGPGSFTCPVHCVQCDEYLIVSDSGDHSIKVFSREGKYKYKFGKKGGGDGKFKYPRFLSVTKSGLLMVCDRDNHRIQVFELNGKFVGKFGRNGSNVGEFNEPLCVALLSNEQIVVCDHDNHRIQIFK